MTAPSRTASAPEFVSAAPLAADPGAALDAAVEILRDLIAFPTVSAESNLELIRYAAASLRALGAEVVIQEDDTGAKANLFATLGPPGDGGIVLSGHTDVVPVADQDWTVEPFQLSEADGRLYGRGTCDMKGFLACVLAAAPLFARAPLSRPVHFAFTYDEEVGCFGGRALVETLRRAGLRPAMAIVGEPTEMRMIDGHKGGYEYTVAFTGRAGHGSQPGAGVNAVEYAVRYIARLMEIGEALKARAPVGSPFTPPATTLQVGRLVGGVARNVIPERCTLDWELRPVTRDDARFVTAEIGAFVDRTLRPAMRAVAPEADIVTTVVGEVDGLEPIPENDAVALVAALTGANGTDVVSFSTEAGLFQELGMHVVVCGPGSIEQAHTPDEFVTRDQLAQALTMLHRLAERLQAA